jgi:hypothetical protein
MPQAKLNADGERLCFPETQAGRQAVREQVGHILASLLLRNSKRFPGFPNYAVESALAVNAQPPTERTVGLEVFGREPDYDTAQDPVVRMTAVEIRKRLTVYYQAPEHANEIRIELPSGSYVTEFRRPMHFPVAIVDRQPRRSTPSTRRFPWWKRAGIAAGILICVLGALSVRLHTTALDRFWKPVLSSPVPCAALHWGSKGNSARGAGRRNRRRRPDRPLSSRICEMAT